MNGRGKFLRARIASENSFRDGDFGRHRDGTTTLLVEPVVSERNRRVASRARSVSALRRRVKQTDTPGRSGPSVNGINGSLRVDPMVGSPSKTWKLMSMNARGSRILLRGHSGRSHFRDPSVVPAADQSPPVWRCESTRNVSRCSLLARTKC